MEDPHAEWERTAKHKQPSYLEWLEGQVIMLRKIVKGGK